MKNPGYLLIITASLLIGILNFSCEDIWNRCVDGNGYRQVDTRELQSFERIEINGEFEVQIDTGGEPTAVIEADDNLLDLIVTHVSGNKLIIETRDGVCIQPSRPVEITVSAELISEITLNGSGLAYSYGLESDRINLFLTGSGQIECYNVEAAATHIQLEGSGIVNCNVTGENVISQLEGSGEIRLKGECIASDLKIVGSGKIKAGELNSDVSVVYISGSGIVDAHVNNALDVTIIGSGIVYYSGEPAIETYISGSGKVTRR